MHKIAMLGIALLLICAQRVDAKSYAAQIGSFSSAENAAKAEIRFSAQFGYSTRIVPENGMYKVFAGDFPYYLDAHLLAIQVREMSVGEAFVRTLPEGSGAESFTANEFDAQFKVSGGGRNAKEAEPLHPENHFVSFQDQYDGIPLDLRGLKEQLELGLGSYSLGDPSRAAVYLFLADLALRQNADLLLAKAHVMRIFDMQGLSGEYYAEALIMLADIYHYYDKDVRKAYTHYRSAEGVTADPKLLSRVLVEQAACLLEMARSAKGDYGDVRLACDRVINLEDATPNAKAVSSLIRAESFYFERRPNDAERELLKHRELFPDHLRERAMANMFLASISENSGDWEKARGYLLENIALGDSCLKRCQSEFKFFWQGAQRTVWEMFFLQASVMSLKAGDDSFRAQVKEAKERFARSAFDTNDSVYRFGQGTPNRRYSAPQR